jgi:peptide/nickel transport system ATP-binding protein
MLMVDQVEADRRQRAGPDGVASTAPVVAKLTDLHVSFTRDGQEIRAVRGVDLELRAGEIFALVGESGSGKSVLGTSLLALPPQGTSVPRITGGINVCGVDILQADEKAKRRLRRDSLGAVFQDPMTSLNPTMRVERQLIETCGSKAEALRLLDAVGVPQPGERLRCFPHELSGGLRQRVMIAMAIGGSPRLVLADEPTTALDVTVQAQILRLLRTLCDELGTTFLFITHDLAVAGEIADRIGVLYGGRLAEIGPADEVLARPGHPYTEGLMASRLTLSTVRDAPLRSLRGEPPDPKASLPGCPFAPRCDHAIDACRQELPVLAPLNASGIRMTACIRQGELAARPTPAPAVPLPGGFLGDQEPVSSPVHFAQTRPVGERPGKEPVFEHPALQIRDVHRTFSVKAAGAKRAKLHALRGASFTVDKGEAVALVGESGCGKSTLLRLAAGLDSPDSGSVEVGGSGQAQMVFQDAGASLTPWTSVSELLEDRLRATVSDRKERVERIDEMLGLVGLPPDVKSARARQLSGGQRQRVALARAMMITPEVLLCDEPTSALDVSLAANVLNLLTRLCRESGTSMVFVTHDLSAARYVADRIVVMYLGQVVEQGTADDICRRPRHPYTEALLSAVPGRRMGRIILNGEPASPAQVPTGCSFHPRCRLSCDDCVDTTPELRPKIDSLGTLRCLVRL